MPNPDIWKWAGKGAHKLRGRAQSEEHVAKRLAATQRTLKRARKVCANCGKKFRRTTAAQRYCSGRCWNAVARKRRPLKRRLRLPAGVYKNMLEAQGGGCAICGATSGIGKRKERLAIDHCHEQNCIRGLLCHRCNTAIGLMRDNVDVLQRAAEYLKSPPFNIAVPE
jgi:hypothetical protein